MPRKEQAPAQNEVSASEVSQRIYTLRGCPVMFDSDLAKIYEVETKVLKQSVRRNIERFPADFIFEPTEYEVENLRSQFVTSSSKTDSEPCARPNLRSQIVTSSLNRDTQTHGGHRYTPFAFTESGVAMLSSVLHSEKAIQVNIGFMRAFVQLRKEPKAPQLDFGPRIESLENRFDRFETQFQTRAHRISSPVESDPVSVIQNAVARRFRVSAEDLRSPSRTRAISLPRQIAIYLARKHLDMTLNEIALHFGRRDHTTILHASRKILTASDANYLIRDALEAIQKEIQQSLFMQPRQP